MVRPRELPQRARIVIIGGGVGGASIAHHLAALGERDVVLLDRDELTSGSTFHSAGLVGQLRSSVSLTRMMMDSVELSAGGFAWPARPSASRMCCARSPGRRPSAWTWS
jgi:glycine/D-amino acid oxidase-like deaminating enzyme